MKEARKLLNKVGLPLFCLVIAFSIVEDYVVLPVMSFIWKYTLKSTPDGFISNANLGRTLIRSPWVVLIGVVILGGFLLFTVLLRQSDLLFFLTPWLSFQQLLLSYVYQACRMHLKYLQLYRLSLSKNF